MGACQEDKLTIPVRGEDIKNSSLALGGCRKCQMVRKHAYMRIYEYDADVKFHYKCECNMYTTSRSQ